MTEHNTAPEAAARKPVDYAAYADRVWQGTETLLPHSRTPTRGTNWCG